VAKKIGNVVAAGGKYIQGGEEKTRWLRCGALLETDKGMRIKLDSLPVGEWDGWLAVYPEDEGQRQGVEKKPAPAATESVESDELPF